MPDEVQNIFKELLELGIATKAAEEMVNQHSPDQLQESLTLTQQQPDQQNPPGFLVEALNGHWRDPKTEQAQKKQRQRQEKEAIETRKKTLQHLKRRFAEHRITLARTAYEQAPEPVVQQWQNDFIQTQPPILRKGKVIGFENPRFRAFVMERLALPTLNEFLEQEGISLQEEERVWWDQL